jgi:hypothetical protein
MRLFGYLCLSALLATLCCWSVTYFAPSFAYGQFLGSALLLILLATLVGFNKADPYRSPRALVGAPLLFVGATVLLTFASLFIYEQAPILLWIFASPMDVLGYYPPSPDMYYPYAAGLWFFSMLALMWGGVWLGMRIRALRNYGDGALN